MNMASIPSTSTGLSEGNPCIATKPKRKKKITEKNRLRCDAFRSAIGKLYVYCSRSGFDHHLNCGAPFAFAGGHFKMPLEYDPSACVCDPILKHCYSLNPTPVFDLDPKNAFIGCAIQYLKDHPTECIPVWPFNYYHTGKFSLKPPTITQQYAPLPVYTAVPDPPHIQFDFPAWDIQSKVLFCRSEITTLQGELIRKFTTVGFDHVAKLFEQFMVQDFDCNVISRHVWGTRRKEQRRIMARTPMVAAPSTPKPLVVVAPPLSGQTRFHRLVSKYCPAQVLERDNLPSFARVVITSDYTVIPLFVGCNTIALVHEEAQLCAKFRAHGVKCNYDSIVKLASTAHSVIHSDKDLVDVLGSALQPLRE